MKKTYKTTKLMINITDKIKQDGRQTIPQTYSDKESDLNGRIGNI